MGRWLAILGMVLGASLGCQQTPAERDGTIEQATAAVGEKPAAVDPGAASQPHSQAPTADPADEGCPYAKQHAGDPDEKCACGKSKGDCDCAKAGDHEGACAGCDHGAPADGDCGCRSKAGPGCPHADKAPSGPEARLEGRCPFLATHPHRDLQRWPLPETRRGVSL